MPDDPTNPKHYQDLEILGQTFETADMLEALVDRWAAAGLPIRTIVWLSHGVKYLARLGRKPGGDANTDLGKALWYVGRARQACSSQSVSSRPGPATPSSPVSRLNTDRIAAHIAEVTPQK